MEIIHSGGLTLKAGSTEVNLTDYVISNLNGEAVLTGLVTINGDLVARAPLFNLQTGEVATTLQNGKVNLNLEEVGVTLTEAAAATLNQAFGITAFAAGFEIGTTDVDTLVDLTFRKPPQAESSDSSLVAFWSFPVHVQYRSTAAIAKQRQSSRDACIGNGHRIGMPSATALPFVLSSIAALISADKP